MQRQVAILQSSYIPWKGYFDIIAAVDLFVLFDDVQFTRRDWRNRNAIKTADGVQWLTIPVRSGGSRDQAIDEVEVVPGWAGRHWERVRHVYARAPYFATYAGRIEQAYAAADRLERLSEVNRLFLDRLCGLLGIATPMVPSRALGGTGRRTERLVAICREVGADRYLSGPAAKAYLDEAAFEAAGVAVAWMDYAGYPAYPQRHGPFRHDVSTLDLLFQTGPDAPRYMKHVPR